MFKRIALVPLGIMEEADVQKAVFAASSGTDSDVSFEFDPENFVYFRCRAITANVSNGNGDWFPEEEILKAYKSFIGVGLYKDHDSNSVDKSIGKVLWAEWVPNGKYVECYCAVDKQLAPDLAHRVKVGIATSVSMGCSVQEAQCSVCGNIAHNVNELCSHMAPGFGSKGRRGHDGNIIYEINRGLQFNELSLVTVPADPTARIFEIYASLIREAEEQPIEKPAKEVDTYTAVDLLEMKKYYIETHLPGLKGGEDAETIYNVGRKNLEDLKANNPNAYNEFLKWINDNHFLIPGKLGNLSSPSNILEKSKKDLFKSYVGMLPILKPEDLLNKDRHAIVEELFRNIDIKYGESEKMEVAKYFKACDTFTRWAMRYPEKIAEVIKQAEQPGGPSDVGYEGVEVGMLRIIGKSFATIFNRYRGAALQIKRGKERYDRVKKEEAKMNKSYDPTGQSLKTAYAVYMKSEELKRETPVKEEIMGEFQSSIKGLNAEYTKINSELAPKIDTAIMYLTKKAKELKRPADIDRINKRISQLEKEKQGIKNGKDIVTVYNNVNADKLSANNLDKITEEDWNKLAAQANDYEGIISGYTVKDVEKAEKRITKEREWYNEIVPKFEESYQEHKKDIPKENQEIGAAVDTQVVPSHEIGKDLALDIAHDLKVKRKIADEYAKELEKGKKISEQPTPVVNQFIKPGKTVKDNDASEQFLRYVGLKAYDKLPEIIPSLIKVDQIDWDKLIGQIIEDDRKDDIPDLYKEFDLEKYVAPATKERIKELFPILFPKVTDTSGETRIVDWKNKGPEFEKKWKEEHPIGSEIPDEKDTKSSLNKNRVIKVYNSVEDKMGLSISYDKGASLSTSFFVGREGNLVYRVAAADVLPLPVQEAIMLNDGNVVTPDQLVGDLTAKYARLEDFKKWAKKRKKKNKKVLMSLVPNKNLVDRMQTPAKPDVSDSKDGRKEMPENKDEKLPKVAAQEETPALEVTTTTPEVTVETPKTEEAVNLEEVKAAFQALLKHVENRMEATAVQKIAVEPKIDGKAKSQEAPEPKGAIKEVVKTENPKGHIATSALKAEAMDGNWTVNEKELEKAAKPGKEQQASPTDVSWDLKEMGSEEIKVSNSNKAAGKVKKYFGQLGSGAEGTAELAMDLKSSENSEVKMLREALAKEQQAKAALLEKERLNTVADKIFNIVATLREKNQIAAGTEDAIIDTLTKKFANLESLESLSAFVGQLTAKAENEVAPTETAEETKVIPQTFEDAGQTEDAVTELAKHWND